MKKKRKKKKKRKSENHVCVCVRACMCTKRERGKQRDESRVLAYTQGVNVVKDSFFDEGSA